MRQVLHSRGLYDDEQQVYRSIVGELGDNALAYSYWATSILAAYQVPESNLTAEALYLQKDTLGGLMAAAIVLAPRPSPYAGFDVVGVDRVPLIWQSARR